MASEDEDDAAPAAAEAGLLELSEDDLEAGVDLPTGVVHQIQLKSGFKFST